MPEPADRILVLRWDDSDIDAFLHLLTSAGFSVDAPVGKLSDFDPVDYGVVIHLARSESDLIAHLGEQLDDVEQEEWLLLGGGDAGDIHCTIQLTLHASERLRQFVRVLFAQASIT